MIPRALAAAKTARGLLVALFGLANWLGAAVGMREIAAQQTSAKEPVQLVHQTALVYFEVAHPEHLWPLVLDARYQSRLQELLPLKRLAAQREFRRVRALVRGIQRHSQRPLLEVLADASAQRVAVAIEPVSQTALLILKAKNEQAAQMLSRSLRDTIQSYTQQHNLPLEPGEVSYQGTTVYSVGSDAFWAQVGVWFFASNSPEGIQSALDRLRGDETNHLGRTEDYRRARQLVGQTSTGWGMIRMAPLLLLPQVQRALTGKHGEVGAELLAGGVMEVLARASVVALGLEVRDRRFRLAVHVPYDSDKVRPHRRWFFAPENETGGGLLRPEGTILSLTLYRDLATWWHRREQLFEQNALSAFDEAEGNLGLLLGRVDVEEDVLKNLGPRIRIVVARTQFPTDRAPQMKLPAGAVVFSLKKPQEVGQSLLVGYQRLVSLINITGVEQDILPLLLESEQYQGVRCYIARFVVPPDAQLPKETFYYNFSPSAAVVDRWFVLSSHEQLLKKLIDQLRQGGDPPSQGLNTAVELDLKQLAAVLDDNRSTLVAQTLLREGTPLPQAQKRAGLFLKLLQRVNRAAFRLRQGKQQLVLELESGL